MNIRTFISILLLFFCFAYRIGQICASDEVETGSRHGMIVSSLKETPEPEPGNWHYGGYLDVGYTRDANHPENGLWRSKSTTFKADDPKLNMVMGYVRKYATPKSRWGMEIGLQDGIDTEGLVPSAPPEANIPITHAERYRHISNTNLSYLLPVGEGLGVTAGLFQGYPGYESYHAIDNLNYTRGYITDNVPYYLLGAKAAYSCNETLDLNLFAVTGYNYLANPNDLPSLGLQMVWRKHSEITFTQNIYYGADQKNTDIQFWRFFSDSIFEWKRDPFVLAVAFDVGAEKQAEQIDTPWNHWMAGALWFGYNLGGAWNLALRPEFYWDKDGLITAVEQFIQAYTLTLKYRFSPFKSNKMAANLEYRYDRSTGSEGGFYRGSDNRLVPDQHLLIIALTWSFDK
jgi:putative OmpL-like beta-barrel porin-2